MIRITKAEMEYLVSKGYIFHQHVFKSYTRYPHYWCIEDWKVLKTLNNYRTSLISGK